MKRSYLGFINLEDPKNPSLKLMQKNLFKQGLEDFGDGTKVKITIENYRKTRSLPQNALFHVICDTIAKESGQDKEVVKEVLKQKFIEPRPWLDREGNEQWDEETGEVLTYKPGTSDLNTEEMNFLIDNSMMFGSDFFGIIWLTKDDLMNNNVY